MPPRAPCRKDAFRDSMKDIAAESLNLLVAALPPATAARYPGLFSLDVFSRVIGMFELNNLAGPMGARGADAYVLHRHI